MTTPPPSSPDPQMTQQIEQLATSLADDPLKFIAICWPEMQIYRKAATDPAFGPRQHRDVRLCG